MNGVDKKENPGRFYCRTKASAPAVRLADQATSGPGRRITVTAGNRRYPRLLCSSVDRMLVLVLVGMMSLTCALVVPRIRRRRQLVDIREAASNVLAGHLADSIANAETVRAFGREPEEARIHANNVADFSEKMLRSWDYQNLHVDMLTSPLYVLTNALGLIVALSARGGTVGSLETVFITFSYYTLVTRVVWQFNRIYRNLEGALADASAIRGTASGSAFGDGSPKCGDVYAGRPRHRDSCHQLQALGRPAAAVREFLGIQGTDRSITPGGPPGP